jgi:hypothetical protein
MNIFFLDYDPKKCAQYHNDKHVVKMILETAQLLCGVHWVTGNEAPYKLSHKNHPCSIWTRSSLENYLWLCELGLELCIEYEYRYGKKHKTYDVIMWCILNKPNISDVEFTSPPLAMPDHCKVGNNPIKSYRNYYMTEKSSFCNWKQRDVPHWYKT